MIKCSECGQTLKETEFWRDKSNKPSHICKECASLMQPAWFCQLFNIPYIKQEWLKTYVQNEGQERRIKYGKYLAKMKLAAYRVFGYRDSDRFSPKREDVSKIDNC